MPFRSQRGIALLLFLFLTIGIGVTLALTAWNSSRTRLEQEHNTQLALQQAKEALIAYATSIYPVLNDRPGDLPCPDQNNDGKKETSCGSGAGSNQATRLGRLPWKSLGLPDLRDASGERLWYAVSNNFKENTRHLPLNSDTTGSFQVVDPSGSIIPNVIAVIIAPGPPLQRLNAGSVQDRSPGGENNPANYLDETASEDNAEFLENTSNGFISGIVRDPLGRILVNDTMTVITYDDLMRMLEKQVATTVLNCLTSYAAYNVGGINNFGRYPWAVEMSAPATPPYIDTPNTVFGRVPTLLTNTNLTAPNMLSAWGSIPSCTITHNWFQNNWREHVFYAIADAYKPGSVAPSCPMCLKVGPINNVQVVVMVGRKTLPGQNRTNKTVIANYLEGENATPYDGIFVSSAISSTFNDLLVFK